MVAIEENSELAEVATKNLAAEECDNVAVIEGVHTEGLANQGPYDLIFVGGMIDEIPVTFLNSLKRMADSYVFLMIWVASQERHL